MSYLSDAFLGGLGSADPAVPASRTFVEQYRHADPLPDFASGWFLRRFAYLLGEGLEELLPCLHAWSFAVPLHHDRMVLGRNAYGALLVGEGLRSSDVGSEQVYVLDPLRASYWTNGRTTVRNLFARYLPQNLLPGFLDHAAYDAWQDANGHLEVGMRDVLVPRNPTIHDGELVADALVLADIVEYYRLTGPIFEAAFADLAFTGWPEFATPQATGTNVSWTATFASYNQRLDDLYYVITLLDPSQRETARFMAQMSIAADARPMLPVFKEEIRRELRAIAATGQTNTDYLGRLQPGA